MAGKTDFMENAILDHVFGNTPYTAPATLYIGLFTVAPTDAGGGTEVAGGSYARAPVTNDTTQWPNAAAGVKSNANAVIFAQATAPWGTVVAAGIFDALSGGNLLFWNLLTTSIVVASGSTFSFSAGQIQITED